MILKLLTVSAVVLTVVYAEEKLRLCLETAKTDPCLDLERDSPVRCEIVKNSAECAIKLAEGKADFGVFTADELMIAHHFYPDGLQVVAELRNKDFEGIEQFKYQSVVVVHKSYKGKENEINLFGKGFCHPGFRRSETWHDRALKYFERKIVPYKCQRPGFENEIGNLRDYFRQGCRPGSWVLDDIQDKELKKKYPEMCSLCDGTECDYYTTYNQGHYGALDCLTTGKGGVAYVSLRNAKNYFAPKRNKNLGDYRFLCENGLVMNIDSPDPCTWYKQPWSTIVARKEVGENVLVRLSETLLEYSGMDWRKKLHIMLFKEEMPTLYKNFTTPESYLSKAKNMKMPENNNDCGENVRWCTVNDDEFTKCTWTSAISLSLGFTPKISCVQTRSPFECFKKIADRDADIIGIDSNYGHLARKKFKLSSVMYCHTMEAYRSVVVAAVRDKAFLKPIKSWPDVKNRGVCFPEYGGIAWLSFINTLRDQRLLSNSCKYSQIIAKFLNSACTPGFTEASHSLDDVRPRLTEDDLGKLCELCPKQPNGEKCEANYENPYYGDKGALDCLKEGTGDIALLEIGNIKAFIKNNTVNESEYRVLCKNGTLAGYTGFSVDEDCALSVTVDSEVVFRRVDKKSQEYHHQLQIQNLLLNIEEWLNTRVGRPRVTLHVFGAFNGTENLLFKDSVSGLELPSSKIKSVQAYKDLFSHVYECSSDARTTISVISLVIVNFFFTRYI